MYGGGFATVPAYLADIFGTQMVGAIHGRLITAWSVAGVVGPALIAGLRQFQIDHGVAHNLRLRHHALHHGVPAVLRTGLQLLRHARCTSKHHMTDEELARERALQRDDTSPRMPKPRRAAASASAASLAWLAVGVPFLIGLYIAIEKAAALF